MTGKVVLIGAAIFLLIFGTGLYYTINYAYYEEVQLDSLVIESDAGPIELRNVDKLDASTSDLKIRICANAIDTSALNETTEATPLVAPKWFKCFNASKIGGEIEAGNAKAYKIRTNEPFGFDMFLAQDETNAYVWRQLNACGDAKFAGDPLPNGCEE